MIRIRITSVAPPKYPAATPMAPPIPMATTVAAKPTTSEMRAPHMSSVTMSTPPSSRPSQWAPDGRPNDGPTCWCRP